MRKIKVMLIEKQKNRTYRFKKFTQKKRFLENF